MKLVSLGKVIRIDRVIASDEECETLPYVGLDDIEKGSGGFTLEFHRKPEMLLATKFKFTAKHVLYGKLRPYLNKVALPGFDGVCTTEILPLLPIDTELDRTYLWAMLLSPKFVTWASSMVSGANLPRLDSKLLVEYQVSLPPLSEQKRIAAILEKADRLRRLRRYALELSDSYLQTVFLEMFGSCLEDGASAQLSDVLDRHLQNGLFETNDKYGPSGIPVIWVDDLYHTISVDTRDLRRVNVDERIIRQYEVIEGDLLFTRSSLVRDGIGQINIVPKLAERTLFECHVIRARVNKKIVNPYYILELYRGEFGKKHILQRAKTATMTTIGQEDISSLPCPLPPLGLQEKFAQIVQKFETLRAQQGEAERQAEHLFETLLERAFGGPHPPAPSLETKNTLRERGSV